MNFRGTKVLNIPMTPSGDVLFKIQTYVEIEDDALTHAEPFQMCAIVRGNPDKMTFQMNSQVKRMARSVVFSKFNIWKTAE